MNIRGWWERMRGARRQRLLAKRRRSSPRLLPRSSRPAPEKPIAEDGIQARVDLVRFGAFAEAAAESMQSGPADAARLRYEEASADFARAIEAAQRAGLAQEVAKLKSRRAAVRRLFEALRRAETRNPKSDIRSQKSETKKPEGR